MEFSVKMPCAGYVELIIDADDADAAIEKAQEICKEYTIAVRPSNGTSAPENMSFHFTDDVPGTADYLEVEVEELSE